ncbi:MAG: hypothetical protein Q9172_002624 [Xanthocarpia lactea]
MAYAHDNKENRPRPQSYYQSIFNWPRGPPSIEKPSTREGAKTASLRAFGPPPSPAVGTFSARLAIKHQPVGNWTPIPQVHMPYNNAAIPPSEEVTGSASLPLARVKRILALDEDIHQCSNSGAFVITVATVGTSQSMAKASSLTKRASAVARVDNLEFLTDVIPKTTTFREFKEKKSKSTKANASLSIGQTTLDGSRSLPSRPADVMNVGEEQAEADDLSLGETVDGNVARNGRIEDPHTDGDVAQAHYKPIPHPRRDETEDVEMG